MTPNDNFGPNTNPNPAPVADPKVVIGPRKGQCTSRWGVWFALTLSQVLCSTFQDAAPTPNIDHLLGHIQAGPEHGHGHRRAHPSLRTTPSSGAGLPIYSPDPATITLPIYSPDPATITLRSDPLPLPISRMLRLTRDQCGLGLC